MIGSREGIREFSGKLLGADREGEQAERIVRRSLKSPQGRDEARKLLKAWNARGGYGGPLTARLFELLTEAEITAGAGG